MAMFLMAGSFRITGAQPDGDSIRFTPDDPANWDLITGTRVKRNASGAAQLRLDAIDALEIHYGTPRTHQPLNLAHAAAAELLPWLGFTNVVRGQDETVTSSTPDTVSRLYSHPLSRSVRALHRPRRTRRATAGRRIVVLRRRRRVKNNGQPPPHPEGTCLPDLLPGTVSRSP